MAAPARVLPAPAIVLFDIDGTLVRKAGPHHKQSLVDAVFHHTGKAATLDHVPTQGMLDGDLLALMLAELGVAAADTRRLIPLLIHSAQECYLDNCPPHLVDKLCPGVVELLTDLTKLEIPLALVTGNFTRIGWKKMELAGLQHFFQWGAFAEQGTTRADLVAIALDHARREGLVGPSTHVSLIGDHPNDIRAARANGVRAVATATGLCTIEELQAESPDLLVRDLTELKARELL